MPVNINIINVKVNTIDKGFTNIGPNMTNVVRCRARFNFGYGEVMGYKNHVQVNSSSIQDNDLIDNAFKKIIIQQGP
ncbi:MAG: hypothetical protein ACXVDJ_08360 [Tumebacillaceae bacterium]